MLIGRDAEHQIVLPDPSVSRTHAQIVRQPAGYFISDLDSSNGTLLNGERLSAPMPLAPGDILCVGIVELRCEVAVTAVPPTVPLDGHMLKQALSDTGVAAADSMASVEAAISIPGPLLQQSAGGDLTHPSPTTQLPSPQPLPSDSNR